MVHTAINPLLPAALDARILKALEKDRKLRYQTAAEIRADLQWLKRDSESVHHLATAPGSVTAAVAPSASSSGTTGVAMAAGKRKRFGLMAAICALLIAAAAVGFYFHLRQGRKLTEKDTVVLADFANSTGDAVFDDTLT
jgi:hypothetical protein